MTRSCVWMIKGGHSCGPAGKRDQSSLLNDYIQRRQLFCQAPVFYTAVQKNDSMDGLSGLTIE